MRLRSIIVGLYVETAIIHPMWAIDEYAKIFRICVWFKPPHPPARIEKIAAIGMMGRLVR